MAYTLTKDLETGNVMIDSQHKQLFAAINALVDSCSAHTAKDQISKTMKFLADYTAKHFGDEEVLQRKVAYPDAVNHHRYHEEFKKTVATIAARLEKEGPTLPVMGEVNSKIGGWLISHIQREDKKIAAHIKATGAKI